MMKTYQTVVGFQSEVWTPDEIMNRLLEASWSATLTEQPEGGGSVVALSLEGYHDDARPALLRRLQAQGFKELWWSELKTNASEVRKFTSGTYKAIQQVQPYGAAWAPIVSNLIAARTVLAADTGLVLACSRAKKPRVSELAGMTKILLVED